MIPFLLFLFHSSFNMKFSTEPSIETLPEFYANGPSVVDTNVINDQTNANFCSDTVRELNFRINSLTEDLEQTDLGEIGICTNHDDNNQINSFNSRFMGTALSSCRKSVHEDDIESVQSSRGDNNNDQSSTNGSIDSSIVDHNYAIPLHQIGSSIIDERIITETKIGNVNCDDVDSCPFYDHFNEHLESNSDDDRIDRVLMNDGSHHNKQIENYGSDNGIANSEGSRDDDYRMAMCMLQSVDLRGNINKKLTTSVFLFFALLAMHQ